MKQKDATSMIDRMNYWKPENENVFVGDCMPMTKDGVFHLYYLWDENHSNHPIAGAYGGHQYAHLTSTDLVHWEEHPMALTLDFEKGERDRMTGSMLEFQGRLFAVHGFQALGLKEQVYRISVSDDGGETFHDWEQTPELPTPEGCEGNFRDPKAFLDENGLVHVLITTKTTPPDEPFPVCVGEVAHYTTTDLIHYKEETPLIHTWYPPECCDYFKMGDYYYYTYGICWETHIRCSKEPFGPWRKPENDVPASLYCAVMKTAPWKNGRRIGVGWCSTIVSGKMMFGGRVVFREIIQNPDGSIGTAFVPEMIPNHPEERLADGVLTSTDGLAVKALKNLPPEFRLDGTIRFDVETEEFGIYIKNRESDIWDFLCFRPKEKTVGHGSGMIKNVDMENGVVSFRLIRSQNVLDLEINGNRTCIMPYHEHPDSMISFYVQNGHAEWKNFQVYSW